VSGGGRVTTRSTAAARLSAMKRESPGTSHTAVADAVTCSTTEVPVSPVRTRQTETRLATSVRPNITVWQRHLRRPCPRP